MWPYRTRSDLCQMQGVRGRQPALHPRMGVHHPGVSQELVRAVLVRVTPDLGGLCSGGISITGREALLGKRVQ